MTTNLSITELAKVLAIDEAEYPQILTRLQNLATIDAAPPTSVTKRQRRYDFEDAIFATVAVELTGIIGDTALRDALRYLRTNWKKGGREFFENAVRGKPTWLQYPYPSGISKRNPNSLSVLEDEFVTISSIDRAITLISLDRLRKLADMLPEIEQEQTFEEQHENYIAAGAHPLVAAIMAKYDAPHVNQADTSTE